jgi:hypothetical protein
MRLKLEYLLPDIDAANQAADKMLLARVDERYIHFLAKTGTDLGLLKPANTTERTNLLSDSGRGVLIGAFIGMLAGWYVLVFPPWMTESPMWYTHSHWTMVLAITIIAGAAAAAIGAGLIGVNLFNSDLDRYKDKIDQGEILMIVNVPFYKVNKVRHIMQELN